MSVQKEMFIAEIDNLLSIIQMKDKENERLLTLWETQGVELKRITQSFSEENEEIKEEMKKMRKNHLEEIEALKVRMAILHQNDLKGLTKVYEAKIEGLNHELGVTHDEITRARAFLHE